MPSQSGATFESMSAKPKRIDQIPVNA